METFVKRFQPELYELWLAGKDYGCHPEIPKRQCYAPAPRFASSLNEPMASGSAEGNNDEHQLMQSKARDGNYSSAKLIHIEPPVVKVRTS